MLLSKSKTFFWATQKVSHYWDTSVNFHEDHNIFVHSIEPYIVHMEDRIQLKLKKNKNQLMAGVKGSEVLIATGHAPQVFCSYMIYLLISTCL